MTQVSPGKVISVVVLAYVLKLIFNTTPQKHTLLPILDFNNDSEPILLQKLDKACKTVGFFHIIPPKELSDLFPKIMNETRNFFNLRITQKMFYKNDHTTNFVHKNKHIPGTGPGYRAVGLDPNFKDDPRESFNIGPTYFTESDESRGGFNKLPDDENFKNITTAYSNHMVALSKKLLELFSLNFGLERTAMHKYFDRSPWLLGMVHYFPHKKKETIGIRAHSDMGVFTLLLN
eukprot:UN25399